MLVLFGRDTGRVGVGMLVVVVVGSLVEEVWNVGPSVSALVVAVDRLIDVSVHWWTR